MPDSNYADILNFQRDFSPQALLEISLYKATYVAIDFSFSFSQRVKT